MKRSILVKALCSFMAMTVAFTSVSAPMSAKAENVYGEDKFPTIKTEIADGNALVSVKGNVYYNDSKKLVDAINALRKEACDNKYKDPANGKEYKPEDYEKIKIKWSSDMEAIAIQRAAEESIYKENEKKRPNGKSYNTCKTSNDVASDKEIVILNTEKDEECITKVLDMKDFKDEKESWRKESNYNKASHYAELISSDNKYFAAMGYKANGTGDNNKTIVFEFSQKDKLNETPKSFSGSKSVSIELKKEQINGLSYTGDKTVNKDATKQLYVNAKVDIKTKIKDKEYTCKQECKVIEGAKWSTDNNKIADITSYGKLTGVGVGKAKITVKVCGQPFTFEVTVNKVSMKSQIIVKKFKKSLQYNLGKPVEQPEAELYITVEKPDPKNPEKSTKTDVKLTKDKDYEVKYENNTEVGKAKVTYTGKGDYSGKLVKKFDITPINLKTEGAKKNVSCTVSGDCIFRRGGCKPNIVVKYKDITLVEGKDYKIQYKNTKKATASALIKGIGNYKSVYKFNYNPQKSSLDVVSMNCIDVVYKPNKKFKKYVSKPVLTDVDGSKLKKGIDYDKNIYYTVSGNDGVMKPFNGNSDIKIGTVIYAKTTGRGWYQGSDKMCSYRVVEKSIAKAKVECYTANLTDKLVASDVKVSIKEAGTIIDLKPDVDYEIQSAKWNKKQTKLTVVVHGLGQYGCTKKVNIKAY